jgi:rubrerythrin
MSKEMSEKTKRIFAIFKEAIEGERAAQAMYKEAAEVCEDQSLKKVFEGFYEDERRHEQELFNRYTRLSNEYGVRG